MNEEYQSPFSVEYISDGTKKPQGALANPVAAKDYVAFQFDNYKLNKPQKEIKRWQISREEIVK